MLTKLLPGNGLVKSVTIWNRYLHMPLFTFTSRAIYCGLINWMSYRSSNCRIVPACWTVRKTYENAFVSWVRICTSICKEEWKYASALLVDGQLTSLRHTALNTVSAAYGLELNVLKKKMSAYWREGEWERDVYFTQINLRLDLLVFRPILSNFCTDILKKHPIPLFDASSKYGNTIEFFMISGIYAVLPMKLFLIFLLTIEKVHPMRCCAWNRLFLNNNISCLL
jgi:hypothetical protein